MKAPALLLVSAIAASSCSANVNTTPTFAQVPALALIGSPSPVQPFSSLAAVGTSSDGPIVPLFAVQSVPTNRGPSGIVLWGTKDPITGDIGNVTEASLFGLEPPGGQVHAFFDDAQLPVVLRDDASGYAIVVSYTSATSLAVTLCDPSGNALGQASATVVAGVAQGPGAGDGGSCAFSLAGAGPSARGAQARSVLQTADTVPTNVSNLGQLAPLFASSAYVSDIGFAISAILKFKQHKDNPTQVPIGTPITLIFIGAALLFLPSVLNVVATTRGIDSAGAIDVVSPVYVPPPTSTAGGT